jgi:hypothetical protein
MAKATPKKRPRNIPDDQFKAMSGSQRAEAMRMAGIKRGERKASGIAGRSLHADKAKSRASEAKGVKEKGAKYVARFNDPDQIMREGKREIERYNRRLLTSRMEKGKPVLQAGGEQRMKDLRSILQQVLDEATSKNAKNAARKALRIAKRLG